MQKALAQIGKLDIALAFVTYVNS